ncbi:MAG: hypothetical protein LBC81_00975 [Tannerellaceae bacterium]|jgi:hypothetical protein|nr:hypothetical protein [Tannerellaceae bacterium]
MNEFGNQYLSFQSAIQKLLKALTPNKQILSFLSDYPFKVDDSDLFDWQINECELYTQEIKALIQFCKLNNEQFFKNCIIVKRDSGFAIIAKSEKYQIISPDEKARNFIADNCSDRLFVLPHEFLEYKDEDCIVKADDLHALILECVSGNCSWQANSTTCS